MKIKEALKELRNGKKRKFNQTVDLIINLKNFDIRKEALNTFISIPHSNEKKLAAFFSKKNKLIDTITEEDFVKYNEVKDIKKLAKKYDFFIAVAPMMNKIATKFGRIFGPMNKMPSPQAGIITKESDDEVKEIIEKMNKIIRIRNKEMAIKLAVGKENLGDDLLEENIKTVLKSLEGKLPRGRDNIKEVLIKFTMTRPIKILDFVNTSKSSREK